MHLGSRPQEGDKVIFLDFDSTLFDLMTPWLGSVKATYNYEVPAEALTDWYWADRLPFPGKDVLALRTPALYEAIKPLRYAQLGVRWLGMTGATLHCLSTDTPEFYEVKRRKLTEYFPEIEDLWVVEGKEDWYRPLLIDDRPKNFAGVGAGILVDQPYNRDWELPANVVRMEGWEQLVECLTALHSRGLMSWLWPPRN